MKRRIRLAAGAIGAAIAVVATVGYVQHISRSHFSNMASGDTGPVVSSDGEYVARLADCVACHSTPAGEPFAGGLKMGTPMGVLYSTNITPDSDTGIGRYTLADFDNAIRRGVAKDGHRLYPAMPYPSYAKLTDEDVRKLYGYFMLAVRPVHQTNLSPAIAFPLNQRWGLALWDGLFVSDAPYKAKKGHDSAWNRGAYLVQGLGHCGSCHTERGWAFNEKALDERGDAYLGGALLDGWYASNLRGNPVVGLGRWTENDIIQFLKYGHNGHATVFGSMLDAFNNSTQFMSDVDVAGVAEYLKSLPDLGSAPDFGRRDATQQALDHDDLRARGADQYVKECGTCHGRNGRGRGELLPPLAGNASVLERNPASLLNIILNGAGRIIVSGVPDSYRMTPFRVLMSDEEIAEVSSFVRSSWGNAAGAIRASQVGELREATDPSSDQVIVLRLR